MSLALDAAQDHGRPSACPDGKTRPAADDQIAAFGFRFWNSVTAPAVLSTQRRRTALPNRNIVAIGTSAGGVEALRFLARKFPRDLQAAVVITIHLASNFRSEFDKILLDHAKSVGADACRASA